jgi:hypothetical protein
MKDQTASHCTKRRRRAGIVGELIGQYILNGLGSWSCWRSRTIKPLTQSDRLAGAVQSSRMQLRAFASERHCNEQPVPLPTRAAEKATCILNFSYFKFILFTNHKISNFLNKQISKLLVFIHIASTSMSATK